MKTSHLQLLLAPMLWMTGALEQTSAAGATPTESATPLEWSTRMAQAQMERLGPALCAKPKGTGSWDYTTGLYADALIRLSEKTHNPAYEKNAENTIGSFIGTDGKIATYAKKKEGDKGKKGDRGKKVNKPIGTKRGSNDKKPPIAPIKPKDKKPTDKKPADKKPADKKPTGKKPIEGYSLDKVQSGVATIKLYDLTGEERFRKAADILRNQLRKQPRVDEGGFWHKGGYPDQMWLDGLYMAEPFYADYAVRFNETQDFDDIVKQFALVGDHTYDPRTGLFYHGWDATRKLSWANPKTGASPQFWSRAIGWYAMGLVDVLAVMPSNDSRRPVLVDLLRKVAGGILRYQDAKTGVWWQVTNEAHRPGNFLEASASCMFVYALAKGVNNGDLTRDEIPAIRAGYEGILRQFVTLGFFRSTVNLTRCCLVAGLDIKNKATYTYYTEVVRIVPNDLKGVGPFINAGIECDKLFGGETFTP